MSSIGSTSVLSAELWSDLFFPSYLCPVWLCTHLDGWHFLSRGLISATSFALRSGCTVGAMLCGAVMGAFPSLVILSSLFCSLVRCLSSECRLHFLPYSAATLYGFLYILSFQRRSKRYGVRGELSIWWGTSVRFLRLEFSCFLRTIQYFLLN